MTRNTHLIKRHVCPSVPFLPTEHPTGSASCLLILTVLLFKPSMMKKNTTRRTMQESKRCKRDNMGPLVVDTVEDLRNIQLSLWELHKLLTDLPDDMLEDSRDSSSPELEYSPCSNKNTGNSPQSTWTQQWSDHPRPTTHEQNCEVDYAQRSHDEYAYEDGAVQINGYHPQSQPLPHTWSQDHPFTQGDYIYTSIGTEKSTETSLTDEYESKPYPQVTNTAVVYNGEGEHGDNQNHDRSQYRRIISSK
ncbi:hypothetical protein PFLUV_G00099160 [Perca fluviatilis]|uniref:Uncharacterized protein n=1 Tax=Perca fluviatilis TaxID=8168 RepID=A0A6A5FEW1_PERFL|nr:hypothetical protein PFLUV_G00099160 [Perca fluviatilis]